MKATTVWVWVLAGVMGLLTSSAPGWAEEVTREKIKAPSAAPTERTAAPASVPVYKPPLRGAPVGRVGGGTRGAGTAGPFVTVFAPEHVGLTVEAQPCLYWYLSQKSDAVVEFTLIDDHSIQPVLEKRFGPPVDPGVHCVRLQDEGVSLATGTQYKWFVALVVDPEHRSQDIIAGGAIERSDPPAALQEQLARTPKAEAPYLYAERGIWYEAITTISELITASPNDSRLRQKRAALLEQVGLPAVGALDKEP
jgi:hypothetical protein